MRLLRVITFFLVALMPCLAQAQREKLPPEDLATVEQMFPAAKRTSTSLRYIVLKEGQGPTAKAGDMVDVLYVGKLLNGTIFDQSEDPEKPFSFRLGRGNVIEGWEEGLTLMKPGEKRIFIVPFELAYGTRGQPPRIPRKATLVFEVELLKIRNE